MNIECIRELRYVLAVVLTIETTTTQMPQSVVN